MTLHELDIKSQVSRQVVKQELAESFTRKPPFPVLQIENDVAKFIQLVNHCLYVGDKDLLLTWGINPIKENPGLLGSNDFGLYKETFENLYEKAQIELEKQCFLELVQLFSSFT